MPRAVARLEPDARPRSSTHGAFTPNMKLPVHRWFRYSAGFSAVWAESVMQDIPAKGPLQILDPFVGSGTSLIAAQAKGAAAVGMETHPFVARIAKAKLNWTQDPSLFETRAAEILRLSKPREWRSPPALLERIYPRTTLATLLGLRNSIERNHAEDPIDELLWLALVAILRQCSPVGTAQWQYVLPNKTKARPAEPLAAFQSQIQMMASDMRAIGAPAGTAAVLQEDAREQTKISESSIDLVVTSPPYPNNYDYADATRIEMTFLGIVDRWADLQNTVRTHLVRSCSQHMIRYDASEALESKEVSPIRSELIEVFQQLQLERERHGGRKAYHLMVAAYFHDLGRTLTALRRACRPGATALFVVGDSAPYSVHVPVERWLGEIALEAGFKLWSFEKIRDRNVKWKNRKHRVPLHEGILTLKA